MADSHRIMYRMAGTPKQQVGSLSYKLKLREFILREKNVKKRV